MMLIPRPRLTKTVLMLLAALLAVAGAAAYWAASGLDHQSAATMVEGWLARVRGTPWALPAVCVLYLAAGAVMFPVMALNLAMAMVFGALRGVAYGIVGSMLSAVVFFGLGRVARRRDYLRLPDHPKIRRIDEALRDSGAMGVALLRFLPVAPFTVFNLAAGVSSIRFADYVAGSFLALLPGAVARGIVGDSLMSLFLDPQAGHLLWLGVGIALWALVMAGSHALLKRYRMQK